MVGRRLQVWLTPRAEAIETARDALAAALASWRADHGLTNTESAQLVADELVELI